MFAIRVSVCMASLGCCVVWRLLSLNQLDGNAYVYGMIIAISSFLGSIDSIAVANKCRRKVAYFITLGALERTNPKSQAWCSHSTNQNSLGQGCYRTWIPSFCGGWCSESVNIRECRPVAGLFSRNLLRIDFGHLLEYQTSPFVNCGYDSIYLSNERRRTRGLSRRV